MGLHKQVAIGCGPQPLDVTSHVSNMMAFESHLLSGNVSSMIPFHTNIKRKKMLTKSPLPGLDLLFKKNGHEAINGTACL